MFFLNFSLVFKLQKVDYIYKKNLLARCTDGTKIAKNYKKNKVMNYLLVVTRLSYICLFEVVLRLT